MTLDPGNEKLEFRNVGQCHTIEISHKVNLGLVLHTLELRPHVEILEIGTGTYKITAKKGKPRDPNKYWFDLEILEQPKDYKPKGRYE